MLWYSAEDVISMEQPTSGVGSNSTSRTELATTRPVEAKEAALLDLPVFNEWTTRACLTIVGAWMIQFCTFGYTNSFGVYQDFYTREFLVNNTPSNISWIGSLQLFLMYAPGVIVGRAFDSGYFHHLEIVGSLLYVLSIFMLSLAQRDRFYQVFLAQGVGMGVGLGMTFLPSISIVSHHFQRHRAIAMGIVVSGAPVGGIVFPIMLNHLISQPGIGFASGVRASAALVAGMMLLANLMMRTNRPKSLLNTSVSWKEFTRIVWDGAYLWSIAGAFFTNLGLFLPLFYFQLYVVSKDIDSKLASYCLAILNAGSVLGRLLPTLLTNKLGVYNTLLPSIFASTAVIFSMFGIQTFPSVIIVGLLFGFASGAYVSLIPSLLALLCRDMSELGVRLGFAFSVVALANLVGNPIAGALLGNTQGPAADLTFWKALVFGGVCISAGLAFMTLSRSLFLKRTNRPHLTVV